MRKKINLLLSLIGLLLVLSGIYLEFIKPKEKKKDEFSYMPLLYKICDDDSCVYVLGSIHLGDNRVNKFNKKVLDIYNSTDTLVVEVDTNESVDLSDYLLKEGSLDDIISEELKQEIIDFQMEHPLLNYELYKNYNLGYLYTMFAALPYLELGYTNPGVDMYFMNLAHESNKEIIELESYEQQFDLLFNASNEFYSEQIELMIQTYPAIKMIAKNLYEAYLNADLDSLKLYLSSDTSSLNGEEKEFTDSIYSDRNNSMSDEVKKLLEQNKNAFIVVGSAHVIGEDGIVNNLKDDYKIELIKD